MPKIDGKRAYAWFDYFTHTFFGFLLLLFLYWLPFGVHRLWMRQKGWWYFPLAWLLMAAGFSYMLHVHYQDLVRHDFWAFNQAAKHYFLFGLPYVLLFMHDFWDIWRWRLPTAKLVSEQQAG